MKHMAYFFSYFSPRYCLSASLKLTAKCIEMLIERKRSVTFCFLPLRFASLDSEQRQHSFCSKIFQDLSQQCDILVNLNQFGQGAIYSMSRSEIYSFFFLCRFWFCFLDDKKLLNITNSHFFPMLICFSWLMLLGLLSRWFQRLGCFVFSRCLENIYTYFLL